MIIYWSIISTNYVISLYSENLYEHFFRSLKQMLAVDIDISIRLVYIAEKLFIYHILS